MDKFVHRQNLERLRKLLTKPSDDARRLQIEKLLGEEEAKDHQPPRSART